MARTPSTMLPLGTIAPNFDLLGIDGKNTSLTHFSANPLLVMFLCNHCPFVKHIRSFLLEKIPPLQKKGLRVVAISSNDSISHPEDSLEKMKVEGKDYSFPYLFDETQAVAKAYEAACTPDFYLFDSAHKLVYRGQLDDSRPGNSIPVTGKDLVAAIDAVLGGKKPNGDQRPSLGCNIKWRAGNEPDYFKL